MSNVVSIVGRPNVGKSTLFNRLIEKRQSITHDTAGTTRDRQYGECIWNGIVFVIVDTGGYNSESKDVITNNINAQVASAVKESVVVLFLVDCHDGITPEDKDFANELRKYNKRIILVANKSDNFKYQCASYDFMQLGFGEPICISANSGSGTGDLLDKVVTFIDTKVEKDEQLPRFAIIGQPNVGKSSLLNALVGENRVIVNSEAGTTRDSINTLYNLYGNKFVLIDTAGIRSKSKHKEDIEFYSSLRSINALIGSDVCLIMIDATIGITNQDLSLLSLAERRGKGMILLVNKWDLIEKDSTTANKFRISIKDRLKMLDYIPIVFTSAINKTNIFQVIKKAVDIYNNKTQRVSTSLLNDTLLPIILSHPPSSSRGKEIKIKYVTQLPANNVIFAFFCNRPDDINAIYKRFLENKIREHFNFEGIPINLVFKEK